MGQSDLAAIRPSNLHALERSWYPSAMRALGPSLLVGLGLSYLAACGGSEAASTDASASGAGGSASSSSSASAGGQGGSGGAACGPDVDVAESVVAGSSDPEAGDFTLDEALVDLPEGPGPLRAILDTDLGSITCTLRPDKAPKGVANFVGLARGRRPSRDPKTKAWVKRRFYDGLVFHRVIPDFMAQSGDPLGTGTGGPGYKFADEISDLKHEPGTLAYANSGPNTNGSQFYVTEVKTDWLDGSYTILGTCEPVSVVTKLTHVPTVDPKNNNDKPVDPLHLVRVTITRCAP